MKKSSITLIIILCVSFVLQAYAQVDLDEKLFQDAKILIFDKQWEEAQEKLEELINDYPESSWHSQAVFYLGKCLQEQPGKEVKALKAYKDYIQLDEHNEQLVEESEVSIIELSFKLYDKGNKSYLKEIERRLSSPNRVIKYMAAFKLSYAKDKKTARKGLPVLMEILEEERDDEFKDRAKIAVLRVDPDALKDFEEERYEGKAKMLKIRVYEEGKKKLKLSLDIPWALADLALAAIPEEEKESMRREGYDLDKIIRELTKVKGNIIEIKSEDSVIKIWID
ncbi:MAG: tetratricopeptide repeat protein [Candidatus Aminicenantaceae bacterium]